MGPSWQEVVANRNKREDDYVARKFAPFAYLGRGHMRPDLCYVKWDY
jgi:hypothetical protein